jgi:hypothetical protein
MRFLATGAVAILATACATPQGQEASVPITIEKQGSFAVGGKILGDPDAKSLHCDHGYVDYQIPVNPRRINLVMWHSAAATAWMNRWDGGEGYQSIFLRRGYPVYIWDGPHVGRANWGCTPNTYEPGIGRDQQNFVAWRFGEQYPNWFEGVQFDEESRGVEPGVASALSRIRHHRKRADAVGRRGEADGQNRSERRAHQFRRRHAGAPDSTQDEQHRRYRDVRERRVSLSEG